MSLEAGAGAPLARYAAWRRAGEFIFLSGIIPVNPLNGTIVNGFQDVPEEVRELLGQTGEFSTDAKQGPILAQSWYVLESIRRTVESAGGQMRDVIKPGAVLSQPRPFSLLQPGKKAVLPRPAAGVDRGTGQRNAARRHGAD